MSKVVGKKKHFLEVEFENKFKQEEKEQALARLNQHHGYQIGSCHNPKLNYDVDECFFVKEDIPEEKRRIHKEIKEYIDPDYLG
jgi:hypothetical protein